MSRGRHETMAVALQGAEAVVVFRGGAGWIGRVVCCCVLWFAFVSSGCFEGAYLSCVCTSFAHNRAC